MYKDGFQYFHEKRRMEENLDLVTAFMFGPEEVNLSFERLIQCALPIISPDGQILLTSDGYTFRSIMSCCRDYGIDFEVSPGVLTNCTMSSVPSILCIPRNTIPEFQIISFNFACYH